MPPKRPLPIRLSDGHANNPSMSASSAMLSDNTNVVVNGKELHIKFSDPVMVKKLGSGQFATVFHMKFTNDNNVYDFAVKEIKMGRSEMRKSRIRQESEFGLRMSVCPFAVNTYGIMGRGDEIRILMELMDDTVANLRLMVRRLVTSFHI
uniref:mitogen-activated protein kinase kinase n=1 Tax=Mesocestoides corti TaxID=53468 RepID=A0A5K3FCP8_MESCO